MYLVAIGEIFLKGKNRITFERRLMKNIRSALNLNPNDLIKFRNRYIIKTEEEPKNIKRIFGIIFYTKVIETNLEKINDAALSLTSNEKTFRVSAKKSIMLKKSSQTLNEEIGSYIISKKSNLKVDLENPEIDIRIEELSNRAFLYKASDMVKCLGGLPVGTGGFVHLRVGDEKKSAVSCFLLMKRGCVISLSKELKIMDKFEQGFNFRIREEKQTDVVATDETFEDIKIKADDKFILRPLIGYKKEQIENIYNLIKSMSKLYMEKSIDINAPASKVWKVLTDPAQEYSKEWVHMSVTLESDWKLGSSMHWKFANGIMAEGKILAIKPYTLLSFSFKGGAPHSVDETFRLKEHEGRTTLMVSIGDFGKDPKLKLHYYPLAAENFDKYFLPKIKELAEK